MIIFISSIYLIYVLMKIYISFKEISYVSKAKYDKPVILSSENYEKAANYKIASEKMDILGSAFDYLLFFCWITFGLSLLDDTLTIQNGLIKSVIFVDLFIVVNYILSLPFDIYKSFVLDKKFGFSNIDTKLFIADALKTGVIFLIFGSLIIFTVSYIIENFDLWWMYGFAFIFMIILVVNVIYPTLIAPIFNKFTPLQDEDLKNSIETLMQKVGLKSSGIFTMDASKRDNRLNAYFGGLGSSKRVVLFDTLIKKLTKNELLSVLGHELGHFKHKDIVKNIFMTGILMFLLFAIFGNLPTSLFASLDINETPHSVISIFLLLSSIIAFVFMPIMGIVSRANEYHADEFGAECESKQELANALVKLADENKSFPKSHPLTVFFYFTHPPLMERLERLEYKIDRKDSK